MQFPNASRLPLGPCGARAESLHSIRDKFKAKSIRIDSFSVGPPKICTAIKHGGDQYLHSLRTEKSMRAFGCSGSQITSAALQQRHGVEASRYVHGNAYRPTHGCEHSMRWSRAVKAWHGWIELSVKGQERQGRKTARTSERLLQRCGYEGPNPNPSPKSFATEPVPKFLYRTQAVFLNSSIGSIYNSRTEYH
jgi:hypothetical protein